MRLETKRMQPPLVVFTVLEGIQGFSQLVQREINKSGSNLCVLVFSVLDFRVDDRVAELLCHCTRL